jgi:drug/metabolite transporter (DMT)-like permease
MTPEHPRANRALALAAWLALCFVWGSTYIGIRIVVASVSPYWFAAARFLISGAAFVALCPLLGIRLPGLRDPGWKPLFVTAFLLLVLGNGMLCWGEQYVQGGIASNLAAFTPLVVAGIMAALPRGERLRPAGWLGMLLGVAGVLVLFKDKLAVTSLRASKGELILLASCVTWAAGTVYARFHAPRWHPVAYTGLQMLAGGLGQLAVAALTQPVLCGTPTARTWVAFAYMIVIGGGVGLLCFNYLVQVMPATKASTFGYVNPAVGLALGAWIEGERYAPHQLAGSAVILVAVVLVHMSKVTMPAGEGAGPTPRSPDTPGNGPALQ